MYGYGGRLLRIDLTNGCIALTSTPKEVIGGYLGGRGLGAYLLYQEVPPGADPLGPENTLFASTGPLSGTLFPGACKMDFAAKSPLTGGYGSSSVGGKLAAELKFAGIDAIAVQGASDRPVILYIDDGQVEIRDAGHLWGQGAMTAEQSAESRAGRGLSDSHHRAGG